MKKNAGYVLVAMAGGLISLGIYGIAGQIQLKKHYIQSPAGVPAHYASYSPALSRDATDFTYAADKTVHAVVHVKTEYQQKNNLYDQFFDLRDFFWGRPNNSMSQPIVAFGSGVIISDDGYIVTNNHVVQDANMIEVTLNDKRTFQAKLIGNDPYSDLALLKINASGLSFLTFGNSDSLRIGEWVLAVGNPFNLTSTVTSGIVSAKGRDLQLDGQDGPALQSFIQTDAAVNKGNSGGALVNTRGELVGINAAIASGTGYYAGYSFAIPSNIVRKVVDDFIRYGDVQRAYLGVSIRDIDSKLADEKNLDQMKGVYVAGLSDNGSAAQGGIREGDVITRINHRDVNSTSELLEAIGQYKPGDKVTVTVDQDGKSKDMVLTLKNKEGTTGIVKRDDSNVVSMLGGTFQPVNEEVRRRLGIDYGLKISKMNDGALRRAGIREGFIITSIDKKPIRSTDDIQAALNGKKGGVLIEGVYPNGMRAYYGFGL